jgi:hypothetical protein
MDSARQPKVKECGTVCKTSTATDDPPEFHSSLRLESLKLKTDVVFRKHHSLIPTKGSSTQTLTLGVNAVPALHWCSLVDDYNPEIKVIKPFKFVDFT